MERLKPQAAAAQDARLGIEKQLATVERDLVRLTAAVTAGGEQDTLVAAITERENPRGAPPGTALTRASREGGNAGSPDR